MRRNYFAFLVFNVAIIRLADIKKVITGQPPMMALEIQFVMLEIAIFLHIFYFIFFWETNSVERKMKIKKNYLIVISTILLLIGSFNIFEP